MSKRVLLAAPRGYCAGVERAVEMVRQALKRYGPPVYVRQQIVHNTRVVGELAELGAVFVDELDDVPSGAVAVFSAHGVAPTVYEQAKRRQLLVLDATCPLVAKVHQEARRYQRGGYHIVLIGHANHEEVVGTVGYAPDQIEIVDPAGDLDRHSLTGRDKVVWLSQTTLAVDEVDRAVERLRRRLPQLSDPPSDDVCYASQNRQNAVKLIAARCELVLVIGSANSSNSVRLVEVARQAGAARAELVDGANDVQPQWLDDVDTVGVTAGASAPATLVEELLDLLAGHGYTDIEPATAAVEDIQFALPAALRGDEGERRDGK